MIAPNEKSIELATPYINDPDFLPLLRAVLCFDGWPEERVDECIAVLMRKARERAMSRTH